MYERIVLKGTENIKDGSDNLPSSLIFSQQTQYNSNPTNSPVTRTYSINSKMIKAKSTKALVNYSDSDQYGNLLNGTKQVFEFVIKFSDCYLNYDNSKIYFRSKALNSIYEACNNNLVSMRYNSSTLKRNFFFIEIPDYSFQSMTMKNYDMLPKVFIDENRKIPDSCIALIKSYTFKKTWIMIDKKYCNVNVSDDTINTKDMKIIIDFRYHSDLVKDNKLYYENFNNYSNLQDLYNVRKYRSPYLDKYWINYNDEDKNSLKYLINTQDKRFTFDFKQKESTRNKDNPVYNVSKLLMRSDSNASASSDTVLFSIGSSGLDNYFKSLDYEIYEYDTTTSSYGYRKIPADNITLGDNNSNKFYEIFPVMRGLVHYIFRFKGTDAQLTLEKLKSWMSAKKIYLNNYDIQNFNIFDYKIDDENTTNAYVEIYSQIPVDGESNIKESTEELPDTEIFKIPSLELTDEKYSYDPTNIYGLEYKRSDESPGPELLLPFYSSDKFISKNLQEGNARIIDFTVNDNKNTLMWRDKNVSLEDYNFNILANSEETSPQLSSNTIKGYFSKTGFREETVNNDDGSYKYKIIKTIESQLSQLNENLYKLITKNETATSNENDIIENNENNDNFLFIYFKNDSDHVTVNFTIKNDITNCSGDSYSDVVIPINLKPVSETTTVSGITTYTYIIPALSVYSQVQLPKSQKYYMVS